MLGCAELDLATTGSGLNGIRQGFTAIYRLTGDQLRNEQTQLVDV